MVAAVDHPGPGPDADAPRLSPGGEGLGERLDRWVAEARVDEAARARARERWLRAQAAEESTLAGVLVDLQEAAAPVTVHTAAGGRHRGTVRAVGADFVAIGAARRTGRSAGEVVVALGAVVSVHGRPGAPGVVGDRPERRTARLLDVVVGLVAERERVQVVTAAGEALVGTVAAVGLDVLTLRGTGAPPAVVYVPLAAVAEIAVEA